MTFLLLNKHCEAAQVPPALSEHASSAYPLSILLLPSRVLLPTGSLRRLLRQQDLLCFLQHESLIECEEIAFDLMTALNVHLDPEAWTY